ncbi:2-oxo acid dehydrogenase subunit E2 [Paenibacillus sp. P36]|uniref:2-oxo acid dehydrogenase subunit E2 n=1 Tax=Paenibacillus sp. P36 TaxID=3342538 RepID=UPI0038B3F28B
MIRARGKTSILPMPQARRHTYHFLDYAKEFKTVYLDTEIDMSAVKQRRSERAAAGERISYLVYLIEAISRILQKYPEANASVKHGLIPKVAVYSNISAKFTMDKSIGGSRVVLSGLIADSDQKSLEEMQRVIEYYRDRDVDDIAEFNGVRKLQSLPMWLGKIAYRLAMGKLENRDKLQGTFTITSLGHRPIQAFYPIISNTLCFGVGTTQDKPVAIASQIVIRPIMKLSLAFDHRAIDGALAADILAEVKEFLEFHASSIQTNNEEKEVSFIGS